LDAKRSLSDSEQSNQRFTFVLTDATAKLLKTVENTLAQIVESYLKPFQVTSENSAPLDAQTNLTINSEESLLNTYVSNANLNLKQFLVETPNTALGNAWQLPTKNLAP
jgi:hypothetical protein